MIKLKINDITIETEEGNTILNAARANNIDIPALCYLKNLNLTAACRMCLVEVEGVNKLFTACSTIVSDGMNVKTNTKKIKEARKQNLELILSNHNKDCDNCLKDGNCRLQELFEEYDVGQTELPKIDNVGGIDNSSSYLIRDNSKCILCGRCVSICKNIQGIAVIGKNRRGIKTEIGCAFDKNISDIPCVACGQCTLVCPTGALSEKNDIDIVYDAIKDENLHVVVATAPSVRVALGEEFELPVGTNVKGKMVSSLKELGFDKVFDVNFGADLTIMEEVHELMERLKSKKSLPMFTSCSPGWVKYMEHYYPKMIKNLSTCKSPQQMVGAIIKTYYAEKNNIDPENIFVVSVMPCIAKKFERGRDFQNVSGYSDIDAVITTRELARMIKKNKIDFKKLKDEEFDNPLGSGASVVFGNSGGVMESALRTMVEKITGSPFEGAKFTDVESLPGVKEASVSVNGKEIKVAIVSGLKSAKLVLDSIKDNKSDYAFIEFMTCPGGCINGGGQPVIDFSKYDWEEVINLRRKAISSEDENLVIRKAHENPDIKKLYESFLGKPGSAKAEHLLHTVYEEREKYRN